MKFKKANLKSTDWKTVVGIGFLIQMIWSVLFAFVGYKGINSILPHQEIDVYLEDGFSRTFFVDFMNHYAGQFFDKMNIWLVLLGVLSVFVSIWINAMFISHIGGDLKKIRELLLKSLRLVFPFFIIMLLTLFVIILWSIIVWVPTLFFAGNPIEQVNELWFLRTIGIGGILWVLGLLLIINSSILARHIYLSRKKIFVSFFKGIKLTMKHTIKLVGVNIVYLIAGGLLVGLTHNDLNISGWSGAGVMYWMYIQVLLLLRGCVRYIWFERVLAKAAKVI